MGLNRRRREDVFRWIEAATGAWQDCPAGITAAEKHPPPCTQVQEVAAGQEGVRILVVRSEERKLFEEARRQESMRRTREALEHLKQRVAKGKLKAPEKIGAVAAKILTRNHGQRYYAWTLEEGRFQYHDHPVNLKRELALEGKYLIQTDDPKLSPVEAVQSYKELSELERAFRHLKDSIEMRPVFHRKKERVQAHLFVAYLGFLLQRALEQNLKAAGVDLSARAALEALRTVRLIEVHLGGGQRKRLVTEGSQRAQAVLKALNIKNRMPPTPTDGDWTVVL